MAAIIISVVWKTVGFTMILLLSGMQAIPDEIYQAAMVDGATYWGRLLHITMPLLRRTFALALVLSVIGSYLAFDQFYIMTRRRAAEPDHYDRVLDLQQLIYLLQDGLRRGAVAGAAGDPDLFERCPTAHPARRHDLLSDVTEKSPVGKSHDCTTTTSYLRPGSPARASAGRVAPGRASIRCALCCCPVSGADRFLDADVGQDAGRGVGGAADLLSQRPFRWRTMQKLNLYGAGIWQYVFNSSTVSRS